MAPDLSPRARMILDEVERDALTRRAALRGTAIAPPPHAPASAPDDGYARLVDLADELVAQAERARHWLERLDAALAVAGDAGQPTGLGEIPDRARLAAVELAVAGLTRAEVRRALVAEHGLARPDALLDAVFGAQAPGDARMPLRAP
jgi:hypothetical protein